MSADRCPRCESGNVTVGHFVLSCLDCKWHHLNEYTCDVCGEPSDSVVSVNGHASRRCRFHPIGHAEVADLFRMAFPMIDRPNSAVV